jgi:hypothetical protein
VNGARYAGRTKVGVDKSRQDLERILARYGATRFGYATEPGQAAIQFEAQGRRIRFILPLPDPKSREFTHSRNGMRSPAVAAEAYEQGVRQRWRALTLVVKAKLEAVASGVVLFQDEFLAYTLMADGRTFGEAAASPEFVDALAGNLAAMLPAGRP